MDDVVLAEKSGASGDMSMLSLGRPPEIGGFEIDVESSNVITGATGPADGDVRPLGGNRLIGDDGETSVDPWLNLLPLVVGVGVGAKVTLR